MTAPAGPIVFVVDDDASVRKSLGRLIKAAGYEAEAFASVGEFLARRPYDGPCCLVLDVRMPGMSGLEVQQRLAAAGICLPVIFLTGHADIEMTVRAMKAGAVEFLTKPFHEQELLDAIQAAHGDALVGHPGRQVRRRHRVGRHPIDRVSWASQPRAVQGTRLGKTGSASSNITHFEDKFRRKLLLHVHVVLLHQR